MKKRYIALGSVVMFLLLLRNKKPKELTVEPVVHSNEKKDVEIRVEPFVSADEKESGVSLINENKDLIGKDIGYIKSNFSGITTTSNAGVVSTREVVGPFDRAVVSVVEPVVVPVDQPALSNTATTSNAGGISTTSVVSTGDAIINKLDNLLSDRSDDYRNWVRDEERKSRESNGGVKVGESSSYDNGRDPEDFVNLFSDSDMLGWIMGTIDTSSIILPDESEDSTIGSDYGRNVLSSLNEYVAKIKAGGSASDGVRNVTEYLDYVKSKKEEREVYISRGGLTSYDTVVLDMLNTYYDRVLSLFKNIKFSG